MSILKKDGAPAQEERKIRVPDLATIKAAVEAQPELKWDAKLEQIAEQEGFVMQDDPDNTSKVRFPPPIGLTAWLPTDVLLPSTDGA